MKKNFCAPFCFLLLSCVSAAAWAASPFTVKDVFVRGTQRTTPEVVARFLAIHAGDRVDDEKISQAIHRIFRSSLYQDVRLFSDADRCLYVEVQEVPVVARISFSGLSAFQPKAVRTALSAIGVEPGRLFSPAMLSRGVAALKQQYRTASLYAAHISSEVVPLENNRVMILFSIQEGGPARVRSIHFSGHRSFRERTLLSMMSLQPTNIFSWYTKNDLYSEEKVNKDVRSLYDFYYDRGFIDFSVVSRQVSIAPDLSDTFLELSVHEGAVFHFGTVVFEGSCLTQKEFQKMLRIRPGETFSRSKIFSLVKEIKEFAQDKGYLYAHVDAIPDVHPTEHRVNFHLKLTLGVRVWVRRIDIEGNSITKDEVIRREFRQYEGAQYSFSKLERSRERLNLLGYFSDVKIDTRAVPGHADQVDICVTVKERQAGQLQFGIGYSSVEKVVVSLSVAHPNVFGTGDLISLRLNTSVVTQLIDFFYSDPYWRPDGIARQIRLYRSASDWTQAVNIAGYREEVTGGRIRFGFPLSEYDQFFTGVGFENIALTVFNNSPQRYIDFVGRYGSSNKIFSQDFSWLRDRRDNSLYPTRGGYDQVSAEVTLPGSDLRYYLIDYTHQNYWPLRGDQLVLLLRGHVFWGRGIGDTTLPFFKSFYAGGIGTVRGYASGSLGPHDPRGDSLGGDTEVDGSVELLFPFPGMGQDRSLRLSAFFDFGQAFGPGDYRLRYGHFRLADFRYSTGLSLSWLSPIGPLRFSYGYALNPAFDDRAESFQFTIGQVF